MLTVLRSSAHAVRLMLMLRVQVGSTVLLSVAVFVNVSIRTLSLLTSQEQMREHPMAQVVYLHRPREAPSESAYCALIKPFFLKKMCAVFIIGTNS